MKPQDFQKLIQAARDVNQLKELDHRIIHNFSATDSTKQVDIDGCRFNIQGDVFTEEEAIVAHGVFWNDLVEAIYVQRLDTEQFKTHIYHIITAVEDHRDHDLFGDSKKFFESMRVAAPAQWSNAIQVA